MKELFSTLREAPLNNHCPKCFSRDGLQVTFKQKHLKTMWYNKRTDEVTSTLFCNTCNQQIFPVDWDEDIERVYEYQRKASPPKPSYFKPSKNLYIAIGLSLVALGGIAAYAFIAMV
ncbi:hypothetical protein [Croceibacter atlanticus]|jgi:hypothetical protein|nr:hypothetical protein [Croceibacter atlanticus]MBW4970339.1 hypothetical protein [Croceibacter atlanticus]WSP35099.1 hypothetical protein VVL01_03290 [Croceibacter atlanticus]|tara:strand:- start:46437 stop:46787 length:351 start_codon:yes stop_codon:yes gene_type:complete